MHTMCSLFHLYIATHLVQAYDKYSEFASRTTDFVTKHLHEMTQLIQKEKNLP